MPATDPTLARLARQHARTAQLMGVDFVPAYRVAGSTLGNLSAPDASTGAPDAPSETHASEAWAPPQPTTPTRPTRNPSDVQRALDALRTKYESDAPHARFDTTFTNIVFGEGDPCARLLFVGEAPGEDEDKTGRPFVGRAGQLLTKMIQGMGLAREQVYICNVLKTRPPNNRTPTPEESLACAPYLYEQIAIVNPEVIVTLGRPASHLLLQTAEAMGRLRGSWHEFVIPPAPPGYTFASDFAGLRFPVMPTYHPSYILRSYTEENRKAVWSDLKQVLARLGLEAPRQPAR